MENKMKNCQILFLMLIVFGTANAQIGNTENSTKDQSGQLILEFVTDIAKTNILTRSVVVNDAIRGGTFSRYTGIDSVDNGMIFLDAGGKKWQRITSKENDKINFRWFGGAGNALPKNNYAYLCAAISYINKHENFRTLYMPADITAYKLSNSIYITRSIRILGDGVTGNPTTSIQFPAHTSGFYFGIPYGDYSRYMEMENILITSDYDGTFDPSKHAIYSSTFITLKNVHIAQFDGDGIHISSCASGSKGDNNNYGNADGSRLQNVRSENCTNGIFIEGCDANVIFLDQIACNSNRRWGVYDDGMLGNVYIQPHTSYNGTGAKGSKTTVTYAGKYYAALAGHDGYKDDLKDSNFNKQPDINVGKYWQEVVPMGTCGKWDPSTRYYSGGCIAIVNPNSSSVVYGAYSESFQPPMLLNSRSSATGGNHGAGVMGGAYWQTLFGQQYLRNADLIIDKTRNSGGHHLTVGDDIIDNSSTLYVLQPSTLTGTSVGIRTKSDGVSIQNVLENNTGTQASLRYASKEFVTGVHGHDITVHDSTSFHPFADGGIDLGVSKLAWKNLFATLPAGTGNAAVRYNTLTKQFTYDAVSTPGNSGSVIDAKTTINKRLGIGKEDASKGIIAVYSAQGGVGNGISIENANSASYMPIDFWTTELSGQLAVTGSAFTNGIFASNSIGLGSYGNGGMAFVANKGPLKFASGGLTANDEVMRITINKNIGIGTTMPSSKAILDISSTTQGFLPPRMTTKQRMAITSPVEGLSVYDLTLHKLYVYDGTAWQATW